MKIVLINGLLFCVVFIWTSAATEPEPGSDVYKNGSRVGIQRRKRKCRNLGGWCIKTKRECPECLPLETKPGKPYCSKNHRCCYPVDTDMLFESIKCGTETSNDGLHRVINGKEVKPNRKYSWMVALYKIINEDTHFFCGGSIINDLYILTAAHCFFDKCDLIKPEKVYVGIGSNNVGKPTTVREAPAINIIINDHYNCTTQNNDAALIKLTKSIADLFISGEISPICLATNDLDTYEGDNATVSGWGSTFGYNPVPPTPRPDLSIDLMEAVIPVISNDACKKNVSHLTENMLCGSTGKGFLKNGTDACQGDSGGPLIFKEKNASQNEQIGIVSHGKGCASEGNPGVYTRLTKIIDWIERIARKIYTISPSTTK